MGLLRCTLVVSAILSLTAGLESAVSLASGGGLQARDAPFMDDEALRRMQAEAKRALRDEESTAVAVDNAAARSAAAKAAAGARAVKARWAYDDGEHASSRFAGASSKLKRAMHHAAQRARGDPALPLVPTTLAQRKAAAKREARAADLAEHAARLGDALRELEEHRKEFKDRVMNEWVTAEPKRAEVVAKAVDGQLDALVSAAEADALHDVQVGVADRLARAMRQAEEHLGVRVAAAVEAVFANQTKHLGALVAQAEQLKLDKALGDVGPASAILDELAKATPPPAPENETSWAAPAPTPEPEDIDTHWPKVDAAGNPNYRYLSASKFGPDRWGSLQEPWAVCANGEEQSPVDIVYDDEVSRKNAAELGGSAAYPPNVALKNELTPITAK
jgi:hypothetical protein